ncbi:MAG TPA: YeeE/YedE family protein [Bacteroidales bacterium]|nr:YeeE/YedE family protein [Bacteroidales bacterium]
MSIDQILGLITGVVFGFLLQKGRVIRFEKQVGALLIKDMTILKFMLSAILVGMVGIFILSDMGVTTLSHKPMNVGAVVIGGILFGIGWAVMGFCPGTSSAALGEGRLHALFAILGMLVGAAVFAELYPFLSSTVMTWKDFGKIGLQDAFSVSHWVLVPIFWAAVIGLFFLFEKKGL